MSRYYCPVCEVPHEEGQGQCPKEHDDTLHLEIEQLRAELAARPTREWEHSLQMTIRAKNDKIAALENTIQRMNRYLAEKGCHE